MADLQSGDRQDSLATERRPLARLAAHPGSRPIHRQHRRLMNAAAVQHLCDADRTLARLIRRIGPCTLKPRNRRSPFEALVHAVTHQQLNGTAAATILKRVLAIYSGKRFPSPEDLLATPDEQLRAAGLSRAKTAAL